MTIYKIKYSLIYKKGLCKKTQQDNWISNKKKHFEEHE